ncbi:MAG: hypothetical protein IK066_03935, partial [Kiritimatiellae bacterium]|nr:hypothetical protein [Kiritimatiellia bacterium]
MKTPPLPPVLSLGDALRPATYRLLAIHRRSRVYATPSRRRLLFAVAPSIGPGPLNLVLHDPHALPDVLPL